jgi:hypothetical protein
LNAIPPSPVTIDKPPPEAHLWKDLRWWLLSATVLTVIAAVCVAYLRELYAWGGFTVLVALGSLPFVAEGWIQFRSWWRRLLWIISGIATGILIIGLFPLLYNPFLAEFANWPPWIRGPFIFMLPACFEFLAASNRRNRSWAWLIVTPALFGLSAYWMEPLSRIAEKVISTISTYIPIVNGTASELYFGATIFGTVLFTRALTGSLIASRKRA